MGVLAVMGFLSGVYALFTLSATVGTPLYEQQVAETEKMVRTMRVGGCVAIFNVQRPTEAFGVCALRQIRHDLMQYGSQIDTILYQCL